MVNQNRRKTANGLDWARFKAINRRQATTIADMAFVRAIAGLL